MSWGEDEFKDVVKDPISWVSPAYGQTKLYASAVPGAGNFVGNRDRILGAAATGGISEGLRATGRLLGLGGGATPYVAPMYNEGATYARPQTRFAMEQAETPSNILAPTIGDYRTDMNIRPKASNPWNRGNNWGSYNNNSNIDTTEGAGGTRYGTHSGQNLAALNNFNQDPTRRWTDTNGAELGGKEAYRYAWEQPGYQTPSQMLSLNQQEANTVNQAAPAQPSMNVPASAQPYSVESTGTGWGFNGNNNPATLGNGQENPFYNANTQSFNDPTDMLWNNNSIPEKSRPFQDTANRGTNSYGRY